MVPTPIRVLMCCGMVGLAALPSFAGRPHPATEPEIQRLLTTARTAADYPGADTLVVLDEADVVVDKTGLASTRSCQVVKILTPAAVRDHAVYRHEFDPATNNVIIESIRVHRRDGTLHTVDLGDLVTQPARQNMIYWGNRQHLVTLPRLAIGDAVEIRTQRTGYNIAYLSDSPAPEGNRLSAAGEVLRPPMAGHWYEVSEFQGSAPILQKRYSVHLPADMPIQYEVYNGALRSSLWFDSDRHVYTWSAEHIPAIVSEPHMVARSDCVPKVVLTTVADWETKSRWFYEANQGQFEPDERIRKQVAELTRGLDDREAQMAALNAWVADNCRYVGTSRGQHEGFTLHKSIETFRDRGGVCKDKAGMLVTMLRVLGLEAFPALTMAGSRVEPIPADQFNHTVVAVRNDDGSFRVLDPTWAPLSRELWSSREALQGLVYGTPDGETLTLSPYVPPEANELAWRSDGRLTDDGKLTLALDLSLKGDPCTSLRRTVARQAATGRNAIFEEALNIAPTARIDTVSYTDPYDYEHDSRVELTAAADHYVVGGGTLRLFRMPLMSHPLASFLMPDMRYTLDAEHRQYALRLRATRRVRYEEILTLPPGWAVQSCPPDVVMDGPAAALSFEASPADGTFSYRLELTLKKHIVPPEEYAGWRATLQAMNQIANQWVVCSAPPADARSAAGGRQ